MDKRGWDSLDFLLISSGVIDSMVNHYTAGKRPRSNDSYSPGGRAGFRPDRAVIVYSNKIREAFKGIPVIIGGLEASLRRFAHYDYWDDRVRRSILQDSKADLLIYGMGEKPVLEIAALLAQGVKIEEIRNIRGTAWLSGASEMPGNIKAALDGESQEGNSSMAVIPSYGEVASDKELYARAFMTQYRVYALPYERTWHPAYDSQGGIPAITEVEFSITSHRGCYGGCSFCALNFHQGRTIQARSQASVMNEAKKLTWQPGFKGYIHCVRTGIT